MIKTFFLLSSLIFLNACSFKTPVNQWQYKSATAFSLYTKDFLSDDNLLAKNDLSRAIAHAKKSADLTQLARIHLGVCALNISVGLEDNCSDYLNISTLINSRELDAYYRLITLRTTQEDIKLLPSNYQEFASHLKDKNYKEANKAVLTISKSTSSLLCAALIKDNIEQNIREKSLETASYNGYKRVAIFWLHESKKATANSIEIETLEKKISILK